MENKKIYDVFVSYSHKDRKEAYEIMEVLQQRGLSVWHDNELQVGVDYVDAVAEAISGTRCFIPLISENFVGSRYTRNELQYACKMAASRSKIILPVMIGKVELTVSMRMILSSCQRFSITNSQQTVEIANTVADVILRDKTENLLYDKLSEYTKAGAHDHAVFTLSEILLNKCLWIFDDCDPKRMRDSFGEIILLLQALQEEQEALLTENPFAEERKHTDFLHLWKCLKKMAYRFYSTSPEDLYYNALLMRLICYMRGLLQFAGENAADERMRELDDLQAWVDEAYRDVAAAEQGINGECGGRYHENEWKFILESPSFAANYKVRIPEKWQASSLQKDSDDLFLKVADYMQKGNDVLKSIGEIECAKDFLECLILSYERLKAYCGVVGQSAVAAQCIDRIEELKKLSENANPSKKDDKASVGLQTLLGLTVPHSGKFDVFISHKKEDMDIASDIYHYMKKNRKEAFFDKYSLPEMSDAQYRKAIMQALDGSAHFVVVFSDLAYLESDWIKLEMAVFQSEIDEGRKQGGNFVLVATDEVYDAIMQSNKTVLPIEYRRNEIMRVREYKNSLINYIK